jgi:hypothetical protein
MRRGPTAKASVAALRNHGHTLVSADADGCRDFVSRARSNDSTSRASIPSSPIDEERFGIGGGGQNMGRADGGAKPLDEGCARVCHGAGY